MSKILGTFLAGQSLIQVINLLAGFLLLRLMTATAYAQYSVAFAFQSTLNILVDLGFSGSIVALVGDRGTDPSVVGEYIRCAKRYRTRMFFWIGAVSAIAFPLVTMNQPWPAAIKASLWLSIVASVYFQGRMLYAAPLLINRKLAEYYRAGVISSGFRLLSIGFMQLVGALHGWLASWFTAASLALQGGLYKKHAHSYVREPREHNAETAFEMRRYLAPMWPGMVFFAFQSQITLALVAIFGLTQSIAEVAALGRLAQLFMILGAANVVLIEPLMARTPKQEVLTRFSQVFLICSCIGLFFVVMGYRWQGPLLWLMGPRYGSLGPLLGLTMLSASIGYVNGVVYMMNTSRKWVFWSTTWANIVTAITIQVYWIANGRVSTTAGAITLGLLMAISGLLINLATSLAGYLRVERSRI